MKYWGICYCSDSIGLWCKYQIPFIYCSLLHFESRTMICLCFGIEGTLPGKLKVNNQNEGIYGNRHRKCTRILQIPCRLCIIFQGCKGDSRNLVNCL